LGGNTLIELAAEALRSRRSVGPALRPGRARPPAAMPSSRWWMFPSPLRRWWSSAPCRSSCHGAINASRN